MSRKNSRNSKKDDILYNNSTSATGNSSKQNQINSKFNSTQGGYMNQKQNKEDSLTRQSQVTKDLFNQATNTQKKQEMHHLLQQLQCPDESMTLSSLSQSPFMGKKSKMEQSDQSSNHINTNLHYEDDQQNNQILIRNQQFEEYCNSSNISNSKSLSITHNSHKIEPNSPLESSQNSDIDQSNNFLSETVEITNRNDYSDNNLNDNTTSGKNSPDFNRRTNDNNMDDLTISNTNISNTTSYRGIINRNNKSAKDFADSVLKQQPNKQPSRTMRQMKNDYPNTDDNDGDSYLEEEKQETSHIEDQSKLDTSDYSGVESFAQTSKFSRLFAHKGFNKNMKKTNIINTDGSEDYLTKRSHINIDNDESLSQTPSSSQYNRRQQWNGITNNDNSNKPQLINRTSVSDQSNINNRLTDNLNQIIDHQLLYNNTTVLNKRQQPDHELEQVVLMEGIDNMRINSIESIGKSSQQYSQDQTTYIQQKQKIIELQRVNEQLKLKTQQSDSLYQEYQGLVIKAHQQIEQLQSQLQDKQEHLQMLQHKTKDTSSLQQLRQKILDASKSMNRDLQDKFNQKERQCQQLIHEKMLYEEDMKNLIDVYNRQIEDLLNQNQQYNIKIQSEKRLTQNVQQETTNIENKYKQQMKGIEQQYKLQLDQFKQQNQVLSNQNQDLKHKINQFKLDEQTYIDNTEQLMKQNKSKDKSINKITQESNKYKDELQQYQQRCSDLENEIYMIQPNENNSIFGNSNINKSQNINKNEYEIKKIKELMEQKLQKERESYTKLSNKHKDLQIEIKKMKEEKIQQVGKQREQHEEDQVLINQIKQLKDQLNSFQLFDIKFRESFGLRDNDNLTDKLFEISQSMDELKVLKQELIKYEEQLEQIKQKEKKNLINNQSQEQQNLHKNLQELSEFKQKQINNKEIEIDRLNKQLIKEKEERYDAETQLCQLNFHISRQNEEIEEYKKLLDNQRSEISKIIELKNNAESNVDTLKEKLREAQRELQLLQQFKNNEQLNQKQHIDKSLYIEKSKYNELIHKILDLELIEDPLEDVNLELQQSFIDEFEQASKHLDGQKKLIKRVLQTLQQDKDQLQCKYNECYQQYEDIKYDFDQNQQQLNLYKIQIKDKDEQVQRITIELEASEEQCDNLMKQLQESEKEYEKLRLKNEETNKDLSKIMRDQSHLLKDKTINTNKQKQQQQALQQQQIQSTQQCQCKTFKQSQEYERLVMTYEDIQSKLYTKYNNLLDKTQKQTINVVQQQQLMDQSHMRDIYRSEVLEMLDKLIDSRTNMPTFNDLAMQLSVRIDKIRGQEKLKDSISEQDDNQNNNKLNKLLLNQDQLKSSKGSDKQNIDSSSNNEELVQSLAKFLKQSQGTFNGKTGQFKNFFNNEDNTSLLLFSELISNQQTNNNQNNQQDINLQQHQQLQQQQQLQLQQYMKDIEQLNIQLQDKDHKIKSLEQQLIINIQQHHNTNTYSRDEQNDEYQNEIDDLLFQIKQKDQLLKEYQQQAQELQDKITQYENIINIKEGQLSDTLKKFEDLQKQKQKQIKNEVENLKTQILKPIQEKTQLLENEYQEFEREKIKIRQEYEQYKKDVELKYQSKFENQEIQFRESLLKMETDIKQGAEQSKEQVISSIYQELEDKNQKTIKRIKDEFGQEISNMKIEKGKEIDDMKRLKDKDIKKLKDDIERLKKQYDDKIKKIEQEYLQEKEQLEQEHKLKIDNLNIKYKKDLKTSQEKVRADMKNQMDNIKNDMAKAKADWEREKKKIINDNQIDKEKIKQEYDEGKENEIRIEKDKLEKIYKKKLDEKDKQNNKKIDSLDEEINKIKEQHQIELKKEKERVEQKVKELLKSEIKYEVQEQIELEFKEELQRIKHKHKEDIDKIKGNYEQLIRQEKAAQLPRLKEVKTVEIQCNNDQMNINDISKVNQSVNQSIYTQITHSQNYIEQLKYNFEEEFDRQQQIFDVQLLSKQNSSIKIFEELIVLEFDKILQSIYHKAKGSKNIKEMENQRKQINQVINDIIKLNDDRKTQQIKNSLDTIKCKITEILRIFKQEVEKKVEKRLNSFHNQSQNLPDFQALSNEIEKSNSSISQQSDYPDNKSIQSSSSMTKLNTNPPTPQQNINKKSNKVQVLMQEFDINKGGNSGDIMQSNQKQDQRSDVKKYIEFVEDNNDLSDNILKKVSPITNQKGVLIVEVDKVVRDLSMLFQTIKQAKFYRLLMPIDDQFSGKQDDMLNDEERGNGDHQVQLYRQILNDFFRMVVKLNNGVDNLSKQNEVYKLKLMVSELKQQLQKINQEKQRFNKSVIIEDILNYYGQQNKLELLGNEGSKIIQNLEQTQFQINKLQFNMFQIVDVFTTIDQSSQSQQHIEQLNKNHIEVRDKCISYYKQNINNLDSNYLTNSQLLQSQYSPDQKNTKISPEMLSPEETAKLIAAVFSRINNCETKDNFINNNMNMNNTNFNSNQLDSYQSFFKTFMSNEDYMKSAENFIQKYRQHQQMNQTLRAPSQYNNYNTQNIDTNSQHNTNMNLSNSQYTTILSNQQQHKKRSRSQHSMNGQNRNINTQSQYQSQYQKPLLTHYPSIHSYYQIPTQSIQNNITTEMKTPHNLSQYQPILISNYDSQSQISSSLMPMNQVQQHSHYPSKSIYSDDLQQDQLRLVNHNNSSNTNHGRIQRQQQNQLITKSLDELQSAQSNVNTLFSQLKLNIKPMNDSHNQ